MRHGGEARIHVLNLKKVRLLQEFLCPTIFVLLMHHSLFQGQGLN